MKKTLFAVACCIASAGAFAAGNINNGKALAEKYACATCHGKDYNSPIDPSYPKLAGQHKDYLAHALIAYKRGDGPNGRNNPIMGGLVKPLSNKDIADLAAYLHSLPGNMVVKR
ncbi:cytochrome c [Massilia sp. METH4]|uniref:c-type cytochrome n=1 Tax=Massilia sp. METH4 TaxID=3123041 RepID=UPI0030CD87C7